MTKKARCETGFFYGTDIKRAASSITTQSGSPSNTISTSFMTDATNIRIIYQTAKSYLLSGKNVH